MGADEKERAATVNDARSRKVIPVALNAALETAVSEMRPHKFSRLPVIDGRHPVGSLSEPAITDLILAGRTPTGLSRIRVAEAKRPPFPPLDERSPVSIAAGLL